MTDGYIPIFLDWEETTQDLTDAERGRLISALVAFARGEDGEGRLQGNERFVYRFMKGQVKRHLEYLASQREKGRRGGRARSMAEPGEANASRNKPEEAGSSQMKPEEPTNINIKSETQSESESQIKSESERKSESAPRAGFDAPTPEQVRTFAKENGVTMDAVRFVSYYAARGWRLGGEVMADWQAAARAWALSGVKAHQERAAPAFGYTQRSYTPEEANDVYTSLDEAV